MIDDFDKAIRAVWEATGVTEYQLLSSNRTRRVSDARFIAMSLLRRNRRTYNSIGEAFNRDHGTVMNAVRKYDHYFRTDPDFRLQATIANKIFNK